HTPNYVAMTKLAYDDWARLEAASGESLVTVSGGLDIFPAGGIIPIEDYTESLAAEGIPFELLDSVEVAARWPQFALPEDAVTLFQERGAVVPAARGTAAMQRVAVERGATLLGETPVLAIEPLESGYLVRTASAAYEVGGVVVCADAWTNHLIEPLGTTVPLTVTEEQVTYFAPADPAAYDPAVMPLWIWMDEPCYYGFPAYGEATVKAAQDVGGPLVTPETREWGPNAEMADRLAAHMAWMLPGSGDVQRSVRCQYTLTHDRDFVIDSVPGHPGVVVGLGAAHGFKFAPTFGRLLADLAADGGSAFDLSPYGFDRPAITDPDFPPNWMV
ncbi:MAG: FAD-dependent oxidoreductase, partial [Nocardioides sp.]